MYRTMVCEGPEGLEAALNAVDEQGGQYVDTVFSGMGAVETKKLAVVVPGMPEVIQMPIFILITKKAIIGMIDA